MKRTCAWCKRELSDATAEYDSKMPVSHGMCSECADRVISQASDAAVGEFLESLDAPVFLVDDDVKILAANRRGREFAGKPVSEIRDQLCGDVIDCVHADLPGGCGKTEYCAACAIRNSVTHTLATGSDLKGVAVLQERKTTHGIRTVPFLVSTEKIGPFVFLQVDRRARTD
jgi:PAS domain-containing protein